MEFSHKRRADKKTGQIIRVFACNSLKAIYGPESARTMIAQRNRQEVRYAAVETTVPWDHRRGHSLYRYALAKIQAKQQAVRIGRWKAVRFGGTEEPIELYDLSVDIGESNDIAVDHPDVVAKMRRIMMQAREGSEYSKYWPLPEHRRNDIKWDQWIFDQLENGIR